MTCKQFEYVLAVAKYGCLSQAAEHLFVSQPTLSEAILTLEKEIGFPIFIRSHSGMTLTHEGESFVIDAQAVVEQMSVMEHRYTIRPDFGSRFSISSTHFYFTEAAFARLSCEVQGNYELRHLDSRTLDVIQEVSSGLSEIGFLSYTNETLPHIHRKLKANNLEYKVFHTFQPRVYFSKAHPLAERATLRLSDLHPYPRCVFYQGPTTSRFYEEDVFHLEDWDRNMVMQDIGAVTIFLLESDCFSIGCDLLPDCVRNMDICSVPLEDVPPSTIIWIKRKKHNLSPLGYRFLQICEDALQHREPDASTCHPTL